MCLMRHHTMKMCGEVEVIIALTHSTGSMMAPRASLDGMKRENSFTRAGKSIPNFSIPISSLVALQDELSPHLGTRSICGAMPPVPPHISSWYGPYLGVRRNLPLHYRVLKKIYGIFSLKGENQEPPGRLTPRHAPSLPSLFVFCFLNILQPPWRLLSLAFNSGHVLENDSACADCSAWYMGMKDTSLLILAMRILP